MTNQLHQALKADIVERRSAAGVNFVLVKLQNGKDNFTYSLHAEVATFTFSGGPQIDHFLILFGFRAGECGFIPTGQCYSKAVVQNFDFDKFCTSFEQACNELTQAAKCFSNCGYAFLTDNRSHHREYYGDGHTATQNPQKFKESNDELFQYVFTFQTTSEGKGWTIHCHPKNIVSESLRDAMLSLGIREFSECPQFDFGTCFWTFIPFTGSWNEDGNTTAAHSYFDTHATQFSQGIKALMNANSIMQNVGITFLHD